MIPMITINDAVKRLGISEKGVRRLIKSGELPYCRIGRLIRIDEQDLEAYINKNKTGVSPK